MEQILRASCLFRDMSDQVLQKEMIPHGQVRVFSKGSYLIEPQQKVEQFGIILSGRVQILHIFADGSYSLMNVLETADPLGADLVCTRSQIAPYHAVAEVQTQVLFFPAKLLEPGILDESVRMMLQSRFLTMIADENMKKEYRLAILSQKGLRARILTFLTMQAKKRRTNSFSISFSREELASFLCVNRSALSHELSLMEQEGILTFRKNVFTLHHME